MYKDTEDGKETDDMTKADTRKGILYGVGVGPGDPKLMTYLAVETIENCPVLAVPADGKESAVSYKIAAGIVKELDRKECLNLKTPMTKDKAVLNAAYKEAAEQIIGQLEQGKDVAYLTLGDPTIYCTYIYVHRLVKERGYQAEIINGVPSFCAVSAKLGDSLADRSEQLHIIPSTYDIEDALELPGTKVMMKAASKMPLVKDALLRKDLRGMMIENCGMDNEKCYRSVEEIPDQPSYYSVIVIRENVAEPSISTCSAQGDAHD
ncbi:MAG: precorrin-2 C(20)-methyltransferase [Lachnospiraceae bacterium]|nr:precorrin-2 C(20)-methyltransferase [Lachnospiraceae bacterium]